MRHLFLWALVFPVICGLAGAEDNLLYKIADENGYINYCGCSTPQYKGGYAKDGNVREIAEHIMHKRFSPEFIRSQFYQLNTTKGIIWQGEEIIQYDYKPLGKERFRHVFWVGADKSNIVKLEIYDQENRLLFRGLDLEGRDIRSHKFDFKQKGGVLEGGYLGFVNIHRDRKGGNVERLLFTDGLSRFSVFRSPPVKDRRGSEKLVIYGNYIYNVTTDNSTYTVVGSVPFSFMEDVVSKLDSNDEEFKAIIDSKKIGLEDKR
jgi:hypothetical protein